MSESPLSTHAGPIAVIAGALFAVVHVGQFAVMDRSNVLTMASDPAFQLLSAAYAITFPLLLIALTALYWRQARVGTVRSDRLLHGGHRHRRIGWRHVVRGVCHPVARSGRSGGVQRGPIRKLASNRLVG